MQTEFHRLVSVIDVVSLVELMVVEEVVLSVELVEVELRKVKVEKLVVSLVAEPEEVDELDEEEVVDDDDVTLEVEEELEEV